MMKPALPVALLAATLATACGSKSDANEENFGAAVSQYLDKHGALCLTLLEWPTDIPVDQIELSKIMKRVSPTKSMDALVAAGVVSVSDADTYKINDLAEWAMNSAVQASYPGLQDIIANAGKLQKTHGLSLTNQGWVANGL